MNFVKNAVGNKTKVDFTDITNAIRLYSQEYFLPEIRDELDGYFEVDEIDLIIRSIELLAKTEFSVEEFTNAAKLNGMMTSQIELALVRLYECSAISTFRTLASNRIYSAKYRNRSSSFNKIETIVVHRGLQKALNLSTR